MLVIVIAVVVAFNSSAFLAERSLARWAGRPAPPVSPALLVGWFWVVPRARALRGLVPAVTRPRSGLRLALGVVAVGAVTRLVRALFVKSVRKVKSRASHVQGFAMTGHAEVTWNEAFAPPMLRPGTSLRVTLRHATNFRTDDASLDGRGAGIRLTADDGESFCLVCNSSPGAPFWDTRSMFAFFAALGRDTEASVRQWIEGSPRVAAAWKTGITRAPASLADLAYWSQQPLLLHGEDEVKRAIRFRIRGAHTDPDAANRLSEEDARTPWKHERHADRTLPTDYLRDEYRRRLEAGPVRYVLEAQLRDLDTIVERDTLAGDLPWTDVPWVEVATIAVDRMLDPIAEDQIRLNAGETPTGIELFRPAGPADPNSVIWYRTRIYGDAQRARIPYDRTAVPVRT